MFRQQLISKDQSVFVTNVLTRTSNNIAILKGKSTKKIGFWATIFISELFIVKRFERSFIRSILRLNLSLMDKKENLSFSPNVLFSSDLLIGRSVYRFERSFLDR